MFPVGSVVLVSAWHANRAEVVPDLGLGLGLAAGALVALRGSAPRRSAHDARDPHWIERLVGDIKQR